MLAAFTPAPIAQEPTPAGPPRRVETTAAKTVPVGAPAQVIYPEPAFGPPEAKFIPAAYSSIEPPEQPTSPGSASTLAQAIAYSYETNPRLLAERASSRAADLGYPAARAAFGPRLDASANLSYTRDRDEVLPGSFLRQQGWSDTASLILSQPLLTFGRSQARVGQAAATIEYRRESLRLVQNEVMLDVIAAYVGTLREAGAVTIARENVALLQRQLEESNARFAVREITLADVQQVETRLALGKTVLLDAQARLGEIQSRFYRAVGMPPGELAPPEPLTLPVTALSEAYGLADTESPLVRAAQARERVSRAFLAGTRAEAAPRVDFRGTADYGSVSEYTRDLRGTRVRGTVTLSVPLFDSGARSAESGQAREANSADLQLIAAAQRDSRTAVATGWNNLLAARMSIDHYRQAVESAQRAYENAQRQERAGMRSTLDVLDLARDLLNVRNAYNAALADEYQSRATLLAAMGQLDPTKMSDGLTLYDPSDHFRRVKGKGDVPLLTGTLSALDGVTLPNLKSSRASPDAAALVGTAETVTGE
ncbi:TolC family outer membrane protein [Novosphingobium ginsenosidimutans]